MKCNVAMIRFVLKRLNLKAMVVKTKHPRYKRMHIYSMNGFSIGRFTIYDGLYSHAKWYAGSYCSELALIQIEGWDHFVKTGSIL